MLYLNSAGKRMNRPNLLHFTWIVVFFLSCGIHTSFGQTSLNTIRGVIKDASTLTPLRSVNVMIVETSGGTVSDQEGKFTITGLSQGNYTLRASMTGYKTQRKNVRLDGQNPAELTIHLEPQVFEIDSVVVIAQKEIRDLLKAPYTEPASLLPAITIIKAGDIQKTGAITVIDALKYVPGGLTETRGRQVKQFFSVRGQKYPYPDYAVNGVWQQEFQELPYFFPAADIAEIEIVRSSAALLTGLSGMAGLINIKTKEYTDPEIRAEAEYGTFHSFRGHVSGGAKTGRFGYNAGMGYHSTNGAPDTHSREDMASFNAGFNWQLSDKLSARGTAFFLNGSRQLRKAEPPADKRFQDMLQSFDPYQALISNVKFAYRPNERLSTELQLFFTYRNPDFNDEVKETTANERDYEAGLNFMQSVSLSDNNTLRFGGLYNRWIAPEGKRFYMGKRCDTETFSGVIVDEHLIGRVLIDAGIRFTKTYLNEYAAFNIEGEGGAFRNVRPIADEWEPGILQGTLGATWRYSRQLSFYVNAAAGQIQPRRGALNDELSELSNESRLKTDIGVIRKIGDMGKITLTGFWVRQKNGIALSGKTHTDTSTGIVRELYVNRDQDQKGIEFELISPVLWSHFSPFVNFTFMKGTMNEEGTTVTNKENPFFISSAGISFSNNGLDINLMGKYVSPFENERFASPTAGPQPLGDFLTLDVTGGYAFETRLPFRLYFKIQNLTDQKYSTVIGYPDFGRMVWLGMNLNLRAR